MPGLLYTDDMGLCRFVEVCMRKDLKVNGEKNKVMVLYREERPEHEVCMDWMQLKRASNFKYLSLVLDDSHTDGAE